MRKNKRRSAEIYGKYPSLQTEENLGIIDQEIKAVSENGSLIKNLGNEKSMKDRGCIKMCCVIF